MSACEQIAGACVLLQQVHPGYDPVRTCIDLNATDARLPSPLTGRPAWGCPRLYVNNAPINLNNYDGYGLAAAMAWCASAVGLVALLVGVAQVLKQDMGKPDLIKVSYLIANVTRQFAAQTYLAIAVYCVVMFACMCGYLYQSVSTPCSTLSVQQQVLQERASSSSCNPYVGTPSLTTLGVFTGLSFLVGALLCVMAVTVGIWIATRANMRACWAAKDAPTLNTALLIATRSGSVNGLAVMCCGLMGLVICWLIFTIDTFDQRLVWQYLAGFGLGGSTVALFLILVGGTVAKSATLALESMSAIDDTDLPEASERNPAVPVDKAGDNILGVAARGADVFESWVGAIIAACLLGYETYSKLSLDPAQNCCLFGQPQPEFFSVPTNYALASVAYPLWLGGVAIIACVLSSFVVHSSATGRMSREDIGSSLYLAKRRAIVCATLLFVGLSCLVSWMIFGNSGEEWRLFGCCLIGVFAASLIAYWSGMVAAVLRGRTARPSRPPRSGVHRIAAKSLLGRWALLTNGLGLGLVSTVVPLAVLVIVMIATFSLQSTYGVAIAAVSMLATAAIRLSAGAFGPIASNASAIAGMCRDGLSAHVVEVTEHLDAHGAASAVLERGYSTGAAALTSVALILAFMSATGISSVGLDDPVVFAGIFLGAMLAFVFAALTLFSVSRGTEEIVVALKRVFDKYPELKKKSSDGEGLALPSSSVGVDDEAALTRNAVSLTRSTTSFALLEFLTPFTIPLFAPFIIGYLLGSRCLAGVLVGASAAGIALATSIVTSGHAFDNAHRYVAPGTDLGFQDDVTRSAAEASMTLKDVTGPALNVFVKSTCLLSLVLAPSFKALNPSGEVFPNLSFWIGLAIWGPLTFVLVVYNMCVMFPRYRATQRALGGFNDSPLRRDSSASRSRGLGSAPHQSAASPAPTTRPLALPEASAVKLEESSRPPASQPLVATGTSASGSALVAPITPPNPALGTTGAAGGASAGGGGPVAKV